MTMENLIHLIDQYGYFALFFSLWLGIVGMPIPDEGVVMTGGFVTSLGILKPVPAFVLTYLGVISGLSIGYFLGKSLGAPVLDRVRKKKKGEAYIRVSQKLLARYGSYALCLSYFLPVVRHVLPYWVGLNKMSFLRYALLSYSTGFVWTLLYFLLGRSFGAHIEWIGETVHTYGLWVLAAVCAAGIAGTGWKMWRKRWKVKPF
ncbi:DedA family protein [Tumebacillus sp. ITR2]|uniref:DedA family protein n=1 Tax=Tumebacillus amylolyticus TaxID=2801339 RepID=A0ABS1JFT3_9BACL|nr:DedA family protein [Tumebacillus amylolyticus]MBL0389129.1 DedA family protein [Tumebacillus amylolyticus]